MSIELKGVPQPPNKPLRLRLRRRRKGLGIGGIEVKSVRQYSGRGFRSSLRVGLRTSSRGGGLLAKLIRRLLARAGLSPSAAIRKMFRRKSPGDGRNHGFTRSGKGGRTGRAGFHR